MSNFVGCRWLHLSDEQSGEAFPMLVLYPTSTPQKVEKIGPYTLNVALNAEMKDGAYPLILISHGSGSSPLVYRTLAHHLASHGFIVGLPKHPLDNQDNNSSQGTIDNLINRPRHIKRTIDCFFYSDMFKNHIQEKLVAIVGHSMGGYTALAVAGGHPAPLSTELKNSKSTSINLDKDSRVKALVLLAPATVWFQAKDALKDVDCPILMLVGDKDDYTGPCCPILKESKDKDKFLPHGYHAHIVLHGLPNVEQLQFKLIQNAGHFAFCSPFPNSMVNLKFPPSQDPEGFNRQSYHQELNMDVLRFLESNLKEK